MTDDGQLLRQYLETQSEAAFSELVRRHLNLVYFAALRRLHGDAHAAADVAQEVFIILARKAWTLCGHPSLAGWLYSAVNYQASVVIRSANRRQIREQITSALNELPSENDALLEGQSLRPILDAAIVELGKTDREAILLRYFEACPLGEVGARLGLSEGAAQKRVERALEKLRVLLKKRGLASASATLATALGGQSALAVPASLLASISANIVNAGGATGSVTLSLIKIMSTTKLSLGAVGLLALAALLGTSAVGVAVYQFREAGRTEAALKATRQAYQGDQAQIRILQQDEITAEKSLADLKKSGALASRAKGRAHAAGGTAAHPAPASALENGQKFLAAYPEARAMVSDIGRKQIATNFGPYFRSSGLSASQITQFIEAMTQTWLQTFNLTGSSAQPGTRLPPEGELRAILGDQAYQQLQDYTQIMPAYTFTRGAALSAGYSGVPLSNDQQEQLVQVLVKNSPAFKFGDPLSVPQVNWDAVMPEAQAVVSPAQWKAVQAAFLNQQLQVTLQVAMQPPAAPATLSVSK